jgi:superfamily II DNA/RNA helicase
MESSGYSGGFARSEHASNGKSRSYSSSRHSASRPGGFSPRPRFGGSRGSSAGSRPGVRGGYRGGGRRGPGRDFSRHIDVSKFVNKAVITESAEVFVPEHAFIDFQVDERLKANIVSKGYVSPTPIQDKSIPHILRGADVVGIANTGTGKTAAFLIPLINKVYTAPKGKVLIVVPTRELAQQIEAELKAFTARLNIHGVCAVGGAPIYSQIRSLSYHYNFLIGTPGRLKDLIERGKVKLAEFTTVVLDEADRMLDMGFIHDIKFMMSQLPVERQTLFFSATMSREIETLIKTFCKLPVTISVKTQDTSASIDQDVVRLQGKNKIDVLHDLLIQPDFDKVLVFGKTKHGVQRLADDLNKRGFKAEAIHGNKSQGQRVKALNLFKAHHVKILVATDVAARGLDIAGVSHVINFDIPATYDDYVHRIGRTGRGGKKGKALTFV